MVGAAAGQNKGNDLDTKSSALCTTVKENKIAGET